MERARFFAAWLEARNASPGYQPPAVVEPDAAVAQPLEDPFLSEVRDRLCVPMAAEVCGARRACGCDVDPECVATEVQACEWWLDCHLPRPEDPETAQIDEQALATCFADAVAVTRECRQVRLSDACFSLVADLAHPGERCTTYLSSCLGGRCEAQCALQAGGTQCDYWCTAGSFSCERACAPGRVCDHGTCFDPADVPEPDGFDRMVPSGPAALGQPCEYVGGEPRCEVGLRCDGVCRRADTCLTDADCGVEHACVGNEQFRCTSDGRRVGLGEPCHSGDECPRGSVCTESRCVVGPGRGERCIQACAPGLVCAYSGEGPDNYCRPVRVVGDGELCVPGDIACGLQSVCDWIDDSLPNESRCVRGPTEGELCLHRHACASGYRCQLLHEPGHCEAAMCSSTPWYCGDEGA